MGRPNCWKILLRYTSSARNSRAARWSAAAVILGLLAANLGGCGKSPAELVKAQHDRVTGLIRNLGQKIAAGEIRNANLITDYARAVRQQRPEMSEIAEQLAREGTTDGRAYGLLVARLSRVNRAPQSDMEADAGLDELLRIEAASDPEVYNDSLIDVLNVLAEMSEGKLAKVHLAADSEPPEGGPGGHLVGNPAYGEWRRDDAGGSFWAFYGRYALLRALFFSPRRYYYRNWYPRRGWSYYGDVGRHYYGSRTDTARWRGAAQRFPGTPPPRAAPLPSQQRLEKFGRVAARKPGGLLRRAGGGSAFPASVRGSGPARGFRGK